MPRSQDSLSGKVTTSDFPAQTGIGDIGGWAAVWTIPGEMGGKPFGFCT